MLKQFVDGVVIAVTDTHYITASGNSRMMWHKDYYRVDKFNDKRIDKLAKKGRI